MQVADSSQLDKKFTCQACGAKFGYQSSLIRHLRKICNRPRTSRQRRKACGQCALDKTRCSLDRPKCMRCTNRGVSCRYDPSVEPIVSIFGFNEGEAAVAVDASASQFSQSLSQPTWSQLAGLPPEPMADLFFSTLDELSSGYVEGSIDLSDKNSDSVESVQRPITTLQLAKTPDVALATHSMEVILRVLRTWPSMLAEEFQAPPLFHHTQLSTESLPPPMAHCITLAKMWHGQTDGSEKLVQNAVLSELETLLEQFPTYDEANVLAALQALVIYTILILSPSKGWIKSTAVDTTIFHRIKRTVQEVINTGLFLEEEIKQSRPSWAAWVHVTSKRRAMLSLYLLHWAYSVFHGVQSYDCEELSFMPAPAAKVLWQAATEQEWNRLYNRWLSRWDGQGFIQGEFFHVEPGILMQPRAEKWLGETDEFGFIMVAICNAVEFTPSVLGALDQ